jgi:DNA-binding PadR family transcriptional regulator
VRASTPDPGIREFGRYADPALVVMTSLSAGPRHGYAIIQDVLAMGGPRLRPGTLYAVLARLEERGLIEALEPQNRRRPYRLTAAGAAALRVQLEHLHRVTERGLARLQAATA